MSISGRKSWKFGEKYGYGVEGSIFIVNILRRIAPKLRRTILLHFGLITFAIHVGRTLKPLIFMIFGFWDVSMTPKTNIIYLSRHRISPINSTDNYQKNNNNHTRKVKQCQQWCFSLSSFRLVNGRANNYSMVFKLWVFKLRKSKLRSRKLRVPKWRESKCCGSQSGGCPRCGWSD